MSSKKKVAAILITTVAISAGTVGIASADSKSKNNRTTISQISGKGFRGHDLSATLAALVAKGTITQAQADAIVAAATAAEAARGADSDGDHADMGPMGGKGGFDAKLTAAQAAAKKANLTAHVTEHVNSTHKFDGKGHGKGHRGGHGMKDGATPAPTASTAALSNA